MNTVSDGWQELCHATIPAFSLDGAVTYETIAVMNQWKTLAYQLKVPTCLTDARTTLVDAIELDYQTFQLAQNRIPIDQKLEYLTSNEAIFVRYQQEVDLIETCAPICNMGTNFTDFFEIFNWVNQFFP